jgi:hypothetical protein
MPRSLRKAYNDPRGHDKVIAHVASSSLNYSQIPREVGGIREVGRQVQVPATGELCNICKFDLKLTAYNR